MVKEVLWRKLWWRKVQEGVTFDEEEYRRGVTLDEKEYRQVKRIAEIAS